MLDRFQARTDEERLKIVYKKMTLHPGHRSIKFIFPDQEYFHFNELCKQDLEIKAMLKYML